MFCTVCSIFLFVIFLDGIDISFSDDTTRLSVVLDDGLKFSTRFKRLTGNCLRQMRSVRRSARLIRRRGENTGRRTFITSRIDYCNGVFSRVTATHLQSLVLSAAERLIGKNHKFQQPSAICYIGYRFSKELNVSFVNGLQSCTNYVLLRRHAKVVFTFAQQHTEIISTLVTISLSP